MHERHSRRLSVNTTIYWSYLMNVSEQFERHFNAELFKGSEPRTTRVARAPRRTDDGQELTKIYQRYIRMGFDVREARFKTLTHHAMKL